MILFRSSEEHFVKKAAFSGFSVLAALSLAAVSASASNLVVDGDFEGGNSGFASAWTTVDTFNNIGVSQGFPPDTFPQGGTWFAFIGDGIPILNYIQQTIATTINDSYTLTFWLAIQPDNVADGNTQDTHTYAPQIDETFGSGFNDLVFAASDTATMPYTEYTYNYVATSSSTLLQFAGADSYETVLLLDTIAVVDNGSVPEPATFGLAGAGLLIAGLWRKLKR
jgi:hypothetical protein